MGSITGSCTNKVNFNVLTNLAHKIANFMMQFYRLKLPSLEQIMKIIQLGMGWLIFAKPGYIHS